ncbi:YCF48-related protein [Pseudomonas sp. FW300-N2E2]|nr:YCF48-related protein [Pseudomonas sp. FW300-N2E2]
MLAGILFYSAPLPRSILGRLLFVCLSLAMPFVHAFEPPLQVAAVHSERMAAGPMLAITRAGERLVAVGLRGAILFSDDQGRSWSQAQVPVSVDLVAVAFANATQGWAVGHGGVILHSDDAGATWQKQLDGLQASQLAIDFYTASAARVADAAGYLEKEKRLAVDHETQPFLDVYFADELHGYVVGTFNRIFATEDGGRSWLPQMHLTNNPQEWHFYAVTGRNGQLYLSGEQGHVWRRDAQSEQFVSIDTPYNGTLFGVTATEGEVYAYGMRGSFFRSADQGQSWSRTTLPLGSNLMRVLPLGAQRLLVVAQSGEALLSDDGARIFKPLRLSQPMPYYGAVLLGDSRLALVGALGIRVEDL